MGVGAEVPGVAHAGGLVPVLRLRVIEAELDVVARAGGGEFLQRIALEGRGVDDIVLAGLGAVHGEAVVMLAGDHDVLHAGIVGHLDPLFGVEFYGIELGGQLFVFLDGNLGAVHDPLADAGDGLPLPFSGGNRIEAPVDEEAELGLAEPLHLFILRLRRRQRLGSGLRDGSV